MSKQPAMRFSGHTNDWEIYQWNDTVDISTDMVDPQSGLYDELPHIAPGNIESFSGQLFDNVKLVKDENLISGKFKFNAGDIIYGKINPQLGKYVFATFSGLTSADAYVLNAKNSLTQKYLYTIIQTKNFYDYSVSVSKRSGMPKINRDELNAYFFAAPSESEQREIGELFLEVDKLILFHQRKYIKLLTYRKAMLEKMFPKEGLDVPEIRVSGFSDKWELVKFSKLFLEKRELTETEDEDTLLSCAIDGMYLNSELFGHFRGSSNIGYLKVKKNDLILSAQNLHLGNVNVNLRFDHGIISPAYKVFELQGCEPYFINTWMKRDVTKDFFLSVTTEGASQCRKNIEWSSLFEKGILIPKEPEQLKIGKFFSQLDVLIKLQQSRVDALKRIKTALLNQMFI